MQDITDLERTKEAALAWSGVLGFWLGAVLYPVWMRLPTWAAYSRLGMWALGWAGYYANGSRREA